MLNKQYLYLLILSVFAVIKIDTAETSGRGVEEPQYGWGYYGHPLEQTGHPRYRGEQPTTEKEYGWGYYGFPHDQPGHPQQRVKSRGESSSMRPIRQQKQRSGFAQLPWYQEAPQSMQQESLSVVD